MAKSNWTVLTRYTGGQTVSLTEFVSPTTAMTQKGVIAPGTISSETRIWYTAASSLVNSRITAWFKCPKYPTYPGNNLFHYMFFRSTALDPVVPGTYWRITNGYQVAFRPANPNVPLSPSPWTWTVGITRWWNSAYPALQNEALISQYQPYAPFATIASPMDWQKWRASVWTEFGNVVIRTEHWNGSTWDVWYQYEDNSVNKRTAGGYCGVGLRTDPLSPGGDNAVLIDDVQIESLA